MELDPETSNEGDGSEHGLRLKVSELKHKLIEEKERFGLLQCELELSMLVATQEVEKHKREYMCLKETVSRLEQDRSILRERELRDQERIRNLLDRIEKLERESAEKMAELKIKNWDLECPKRKIFEEDVEAQILRIVKESFHVVEKEKRVEKSSGKDALEVDEEMPNRTTESENNGGTCNESHGDSDDEEDVNPISRLNKKAKEHVPKQSNGKLPFDIGNEKKKKFHVCEVIDNESEDESDDNDEENRVPINKLSKKRAAEANEKDSVGEEKETSAEVEEIEIPLTPANNRKEKSNKSLRPKKKLKLSDSRCSTEGSPRSPGRNDISNEGIQASVTSCHRSTNNTKNQSDKRAYAGRIASPEQLCQAQNRAKALQSDLKTQNPSFIRAMALSHVSGGFWLGLPTRFCKENLPSDDQKMILEDEKGLEFKAKYIGNRTALSGGWRGFAMSHKLELGDILIFDLIEPARFKVYIIKAIQEEQNEQSYETISGECSAGKNKSSNTNVIIDQDADLSVVSRRHLQKFGVQIKAKEEHA